MIFSLSKSMNVFGLILSYILPVAQAGPSSELSVQSRVLSQRKSALMHSPLSQRHSPSEHSPNVSFRAAVFVFFEHSYANGVFIFHGSCNFFFFANIDTKQ